MVSLLALPKDQICSIHTVKSFNSTFFLCSVCINCMINCDRLCEKGSFRGKIAPGVSHRKNSFFLQFLFFAELVLVTLTLSLCQISNVKTT